MLAVILVAFTGIIPTAFAQTASTGLEAKDLIPAGADMVFELNTSVKNPLEDLIKSELADQGNELATLMLSLAENNIISMAIGNIADTGNEDMFLSMEMSAENFAKVIETSKATESEIYNNIKLYKLEEAVYTALVKNLLVISDSPENLKKAIDNQSQPVNSIGALTAYKSVKSHDVTNNFFNMYMDPSVFMEYLGEGVGGDKVSIETMAKNGIIFAGLISAMDGESLSVNQNDTGFGFGVAVHADSAKLAEIGYVIDKYNFNPSLYQLLSGKGLLFYQERTNLKEQLADILKMIELDTAETTEYNNFKTEFKKETLVDFDSELLALFGDKYMITAHNTDHLLPGITGIFKVNDPNKAGAIALKLSDYIGKKLKEEQPNYSAKIYDYNISSAGGTSFYDYTIYLKAMDDGGDLEAVTDSAATLNLRLAVTTDGYFVISTLPDLNAYFKKGGEGLLENAGLKAAFTNPSGESNEVIYLDVDSLHQYIGVLMNIFEADSQTKEEISTVFSPWHGLFIRGEATNNSAWVKGQVNVDVDKLGDFATNFAAAMDSFGGGLGTDYASNLTNEADILAPFGVEKQFCDVSESDWFYPFVTELSSRMIIGGYEDGCFRPNQPITRAEFIKLAMKAIGSAAAINSSYQPFKDVPPIYGEWYSEDINMASMLGYIGGYADGTFKPNATISRAEAIQILYNMSNVLPGVNVIDQPLEGLISFSDVKKTDWFFTPVVAASYYDIIDGTTDKFEPNRNLTRAETAKIINLLMDVEATSL